MEEDFVVFSRPAWDFQFQPVRRMTVLGSTNQDLTTDFGPVTTRRLPFSLSRGSPGLKLDFGSHPLLP